jgi:regulator of PEP synthase PpsR (kinase-PPPase family)
VAHREILHLVSDATGDTVSAAATAALARFDALEPERRLHVFVRKLGDLDAVLEDIARAPGPIIFTVVDPAIAARLTEFAQARGLEAVNLLDPLTQALRRCFGRSQIDVPGAQYDTGEAYLRRIAAIDFAMRNDDGAAGERFSAADVILAGVSRTSKTPTCIYLACRGVKAANAPIVPHKPLPDGLAEAVERGVPVIGLTINPNRLAHIRAHRLETLGQSSQADYADLDAIRREVAEARIVMEGLGAPIIDVTRRSIEETAASVMAILRERERA